MRIIKERGQEDNRGHSPISPSKFKLAMACPGFYELSKKAPKREASASASSGTLTHAICEEVIHDMSLTKEDLLKQFTEAKEDQVDRALEFGEFIHDLILTTEADEVHIITEKCYDIWPKLEVWGKADVSILFYREGEKKPYRATLVDYKDGAGVDVETVGNPQLAGYAIGLAKAYSVDQICAIIYQPLTGDKKFNIWDLTLRDLKEWSFKLQESVKACHKKDAPINLGEHCKSCFCPAIAICPAHIKQAQEIAQTHFNKELPEPSGLSPEQISEFITKMPDVINWFEKSLKPYVLQIMLEGVSVSGLKLAESVARRKWKFSERLVIEELEKRGIDPYKKSLRTFGEIEKEVGVSSIADLLEKPEPKPCVVAVDSKMKDYKGGSNLFNKED